MTEDDMNEYRIRWADSSSNASPPKDALVMKRCGCAACGGRGCIACGFEGAAWLPYCTLEQVTPRDDPHPETENESNQEQTETTIKLSSKRRLAIWHAVQGRLNRSRIEIVKVLKQYGFEADVVREVSTILVNCHAANAAIEAARTGERQ